jgi:hypothetical protein
MNTTARINDRLESALGRANELMREYPNMVPKNAAESAALRCLLMIAYQRWTTPPIYTGERK